MNELRIETEYEVFYPGNQAVVTAVWSLDKEPQALELRLDSPRHHRVVRRHFGSAGRRERSDGERGADQPFA